MISDHKGTSMYSLGLSCQRRRLTYFGLIDVHACSSTRSFMIPLSFRRRYEPCRIFYYYFARDIDKVPNMFTTQVVSFLYRVGILVGKIGSIT